MLSAIVVAGLTDTGLGDRIRQSLCVRWQLTGICCAGHERKSGGDSNNKKFGENENSMQNAPVSCQQNDDVLSIDN